MTDYKKTRFKTDVLVIGAGMAGWFAADKAVAAGARVILTDKGYIGKVGQSCYARDLFVCNPEWGDDADSIIRQVTEAGEYVNNRYWTKRVIDESYDRFLDMVSWGIGFAKNEDGSFKRDPMVGNIPVLILSGSGMESHPYNETTGYAARKHMEEIGVDLLDRVMIAELLIEDGQVKGAVGFRVDKEEIIIIDASAVVLCTGGCGLRPVGYSCVATSTGDGERMAFEAGAPLVGKEYPQPMRSSVENPAILGGRGLEKGNGIVPNSAFAIVANKFWKQGGEAFKPHEGKKAAYPFAYLDLELEVHAGRGPVTTEINGDEYHVVSGGALGMSVRKADGVWPDDENCGTGIPGLYAAGDALGTMQNGALYMLCGASIGGCAVTGAIAGKAAAREVLTAGNPVSEETVNNVVAKVIAPACAASGYSPRWAIQMLQNTMSPYFISYVKEGSRLEGALSYVKFIREHIIPMLRAENVHELRLTHEANSMALSCEVRLKSALFRQESRGMHFREDFPYRDDENWLCWTRVENIDGEVTPVKFDIPDEWKPDKSLSYEEKYTYRYPGEEEWINGYREN